MGVNDNVNKKSGRVKIFASHHPFFFALAFFLISFCLDSGIIVVGQHSPLAMIDVEIVDVIVQSLIALGGLIWLGWLSAAGFNSPSRWHSLYLLWLPALLSLFYLASALVTPASGAIVVILAIMNALLIGLDEEARFRGVILQALLPYGSVGGAVLSSLFFGLAHLNNLLTHAPGMVVLAQVIGGILLGFGFAACRLRTRTIWPLIIFHMLYDLPANITLYNTRSFAVVSSMLSTTSLVTVTIALIAPGCILACYGLFLLRPRPQPAKLSETLL